MSRRRAGRARRGGLLVLAAAGMILAPSLTAEPAEPPAAVIEVGADGLTVATALQKLADEAGMKLVAAVPVELADQPLDVLAGRQPAGEALKAVQAMLGVDAYTTGQTTALRPPLRLNPLHLNQMEALTANAEYLDSLPAEVRDDLTERRWLDIMPLPVAQRQPFAARFGNDRLRFAPGHWRFLPEGYHLAVGYVADPYMLVGGGDGRTTVSYYVRTKWRFVQFDRFSLPDEHGLTAALGDGTERPLRRHPGAVIAERSERRMAEGRIAPAPPLVDLPWPTDEGGLQQANDPYDPSALGAAVALRRYLAELQAESWARPDGSERLLRSELISAEPTRPTAVESIGDALRRGFRITVLLYWATAWGESPVPHDGAAVATHRTEQATSFFGVGPTIRQLRIDRMAYRVVPGQVSDPTTVGDLTVISARDWRVERQPTLLRSITLDEQQATGVLATMDLVAIANETVRSQLLGEAAAAEDER